MATLYFGKFSKHYPEQIEGRFYTAGPEGESWYGGIQPGDLIFPIYDGKVSELWQMTGYEERQGKSRRDKGRANFKVLKTYEHPVKLTYQFISSRHFHLNLNMVNKSVKSAKGMGFFPIETTDSAPSPMEMDFEESSLRRIFVTWEGTKPEGGYRQGDIRVLIEDAPSDEEAQEKSIREVQEYRDSGFLRYAPLMDLYEKRNIPGERYSLTQLLEWAKKDGAVKKEKYLTAVLEDLDEDGIFQVLSAVALYDNILVGRKRTASSAKKQRDREEAAAREEYKLNDEEDSLTDEDLETYDLYRHLLHQNPNLILYGPPGTGKTYAVEKIVENMEQYRTGEFVDFGTVKEEERVDFITFHQSFSYEEFIEGIRPVLGGHDAAMEQKEDQPLGYRVEDGILKRLAARASVNRIKEELAGPLERVNLNSRVFKISLGMRQGEEYLYQHCKQESYISIGWLRDDNLSQWDHQRIYEELQQRRGPREPAPTNDASSINYFVNEMVPGDVVLVYDGRYTIRDIVVVEGEYSYVRDDGDHYPHRRKVAWLKHFDEPEDIREMNQGKQLTMKTVYPLSSISLSDLEPLLANAETQAIRRSAKESLPHYLIIDEINRGNISKIFGELITLIEADKRDRVKTRLPYSRKEFSLPKNLYIIGTMNTADRSIAMIDTALRRRFIFAEIEPDPRVLSKSDTPLVGGKIDLEQLLEELNRRIVREYDRDHRIGHAYFMDLNNLEAFRIAWYYKIIPLLMDYFYNDGETIAKILSPAFMDPETCQVRELKGQDFISAVVRICHDQS